MDQLDHYSLLTASQHRIQRTQSFLQLPSWGDAHQGAGQAGHSRRGPGVKFPKVHLPQGVPRRDTMGWSRAGSSLAALTDFLGKIVRTVPAT